MLELVRLEWEPDAHNEGDEGENQDQAEQNDDDQQRAHYEIVIIARKR